MSDQKMDIVIVGGGIIGCTTAYYLTRHPSYNPSLHTITLLEATRIAGGASGKAGGLLAEWAYPASITALSFSLHDSLATSHAGETSWGYRRIRCGKLIARASSLPPKEEEDDSSAWAQLASWIPLGKRRFQPRKHPKEKEHMPEDLEWFEKDCVEGYEDISTSSATAQVHPLQFTKEMARLAEEKGAKVIIGSVDKINYVTSDTGKKVESVTYTDKASAGVHTIPTTHLVLAAGPWTPVLFPSAPISALRAHSITIRHANPISAYCLFTEITVPVPDDSSSPQTPHSNDADADADDEHSEADEDYINYQHDHYVSASSPRSEKGTTKLTTPEIYSRPNNEVYVAGSGDTNVPLPATTDDVEISRASCAAIFDSVSSISPELAAGSVTSRRACYLPTVDVGGGNPLIGETGIGGLLLATGHSCWGINNAPATGLLIGEMIFDGEAKSANIQALDPRLVV